MRSVALIAVLAFTLAGCSSSSTPTTTTTGTMTGMDHMHMAAKTVDVALSGNRFVNDTVTIYVGDSVKWTNKDSVGHSVTSDAGQTDTFDNKPNCAAGVLPSPVCMASGETFSHTFAKAGSTKYHCRAHSGMVGTIVVQEHPMM